jgi:hypothetical protein
MSDEEAETPNQTNEPKQNSRSRVRQDKKECLKAYSELRAYRLHLERLVRKKKKELEDLKIDEKADILERKNECANDEYYCQICKYKMISAERKVHEFMHAKPKIS